MSLEEALTGREIPANIREPQTLLDIPFLSFDGEKKVGQLVIHTDLAGDIKEIFQELLLRGFPIEKMIPVVAYDWDDDASMVANNTSAFNYRPIAGTTRLSHHATGRAIDINPVLNPYMRDTVVAPQGAVYDTKIPGTITEEIAELFKTRGWEWGGEWTTLKDYQHFEKPEVREPRRLSFALHGR